MPESSPVLVLAGRTFVVPELTTFEQDLWIMQNVRTAGLDDLPSDRRGPAVTKAILERVLSSGRTMHLLAGVLVEQGAAWSPQSAEANVRFFAALTAPADKRQLQTHLVGMLALFFVRGEISSETSLRSSPEASATRGDRQAESEALPNSENGESSSESSPTTTRRGSRRSSRGRSATASSRTSSG